MGVIVTGRRLLNPTIGGEDTGVILRAVIHVGEDTDAVTLWQTCVTPTLAHAGHEQVVIRTLVDYGVGALILTEEETGFVVIVHLELVGLLASALDGFAWVADTTAELRVLHSAQITRGAGLGVGRAVDAVDKGLAVSTNKLATGAFTDIVQLVIGYNGSASARLASLYLGNI